MTHPELGGALEQWAKSQEFPELKDFSASSPDLGIFAVSAVAQLIRERLSRDVLLVPLPGADAWFGNDVGRSVDSKSLWTMLPHHTATRTAQILRLPEQPSRIIGIAGVLREGMVEGFEASLADFEGQISIAALWDCRVNPGGSQIAVSAVFAGEFLAEAVPL